jgi:hypothetical protein
MPADPRAVVEFKVAAVDLRPGDLVNTNPSDQDWQEVVGVFARPADAKSDEVKALADTIDGRYVVVQLTDIRPVDSGVFFSGGQALIYGSDEDSDSPVAETISTDDGVRTYLYTKFELVTVRSTAATV